MLKVVGASWLKTRISSYILAAALLLAIGSLFLAEMDRPKYNGIYCSTVSYSEKYNFQVESLGQQNNLSLIPKRAARACYKDSIKTNGWSQLEVETQPGYPDWVQAYGAGLLEGSLTWKSIHDHWLNTVDAYCEKDEQSQKFCEWLRDTLHKNREAIIDMADINGQNDHYWYQVRLFYHQVAGLEFGWRRAVERSRSDLFIPEMDFLLLNAASDIPDLRIYYENFINNSDDYEYHPRPVKASMLVKFLHEENGVTPRKILLGHSSDGNYASMLRVLKKYKFHFHFTGNHKTREVYGIDIAFTGYPGNLASSDDFYIVNGKRTKMTVAGIRIQNHNMNLWKNVNIEDNVLLSARVMAANRLAHSGRTWAKIMARNPGFGAKQWLIIDVKRLHNDSFLAQSKSEAVMPSNIPITAVGLEDLDKPVIMATVDEPTPVRSKNGAVWIIDQLPGRLHAEDMTQEIVYDNGFWTGNGIPYFKEMLEASNIEYNGSAQKSFQKVSSTNITDLDAVAKVLKSRAYRGDLMGENASAFGNIDIKLFSETSNAQMEFRTIAGPLFYYTNNHHKTIKDNHKSTIINKDDSSNSESADVVAVTTILPSDTNENGDSDDDGDEYLVSDVALPEIDIYSERRSVRDDIRAIAQLKANGPFKWSQTHLDVDHEGHPDTWNFDHVSPTWAWKHDNV